MTHVVVVADARYPIAEPFAGGMQAMTWHLVRGLRARGVDVTVAAAPGSDPDLDAVELPVRPPVLSAVARNDVSMGPDEWAEQHHAYLQLMLGLARRRDVEVVHNNSLHHLPVAMAETLHAPMVTTLHTPPTPWLEPVVRLADPTRSHYAAVSGYTARQWSHVASPHVVRNGIDLVGWPPGLGGQDLVWFGRLVPEKAPHLAIEIATRTGRRLLLAGPVADPVYWREQVEPRLGEQVVHLGHLDQRRLSAVVGRCAAALVTPVWEEPYGLVGAEAIACGTPVVGFARGGMSEVLDEDCSRLVDPSDPGWLEAAARAVDEAVALPRARVRASAVARCSMDATVEGYLDLYGRLVTRRAA